MAETDNTMEQNICSDMIAGPSKYLPLRSFGPESSLQLAQSNFAKRYLTKAIF